MATVDQTPGLDRSRIYNTNPDIRREGARGLVSRYLKDNGGVLVQTAALNESQGSYVAETFPFVDSVQLPTRKGLEGRSAEDGSRLDRSTLVDSPDSGVILFTVALPSYSSMLDNLDRASTSRTGVPIPPKMTTPELIRLKAMHGEGNLEYLARVAFIDPAQAESTETVALATHPESDYGRRIVTKNPIRTALALVFGTKVISPKEIDPDNPRSDLSMNLLRSLGRRGSAELWRYAANFEGFRVLVRVANVDPQKRP